MKSKQFLQPPTLLAILFCYLLANFLVLLNQGVYWDDWTLYNTSFVAIKQQFYGNGYRYLAYVHHYLQNFSHPKLLYNILTLAFEILSIISLYRIFELLHLKRSFFRWVLLLFAVAPLFAAKNTMICMPYAAHTAFFFLGFYLWVYSYKKRNLVARLLSLVLFFSSFIVNSFIFFYLLPLATIFVWRSNINILHLKAYHWKAILNIKFWINNLDFILLPFVFYLFKNKMFKTSGLYAANNYNEISLKGLLSAPLETIGSLFTTLGGIFEKSGQVLSQPLFFLLLTSIFVLVLAVFLSKNSKTVSKNNDQYTTREYQIILCLGLLLFFIGAFPYAVVKKLPSFEGYETRHQLLLPLGLSIIIISTISILVKQKFINVIFIGIAAIFISISNKNNLQYIKGWIKQESIIYHFQKKATEESGATYLLLDYSKKDNATSRDYSFYNLNGLMKKATAKQQVLMAPYEEYKKGDWRNYMAEAAKFNMQNYDFKDFNNPLVLKFDDGPLSLTDTTTFKLLFQYYLKKVAFKYNLPKVVEVSLWRTNWETESFFMEDKK